MQFEVEKLGDWKKWEAAGDYFSYRGEKIFYIEGGQIDAPVLVLIHGFPTASWDWHKVWEPLCQNFRVLAFDMIGFGLSAKPAKYEYSIKDQADLLESLLQLKGVTHYHLLAHDYGVTVAQELLARAAETNSTTTTRSIDSLVLLNGGLFPETHKPVLIQKLLISPLGGLVARLGSFARFKQNFDKICAHALPDNELETFWELLLLENGKAIMPKLIRYMVERRRNRERWVGALQNTQTPIRLINGLEDPISGAHMLVRYRELIDDPDIHELPGVGHYPQVEAPEAVYKACQSYWQALEII